VQRILGHYSTPGSSPSPADTVARAWRLGTVPELI
jgi:hypothetical protein